MIIQLLPIFHHEELNYICLKLDMKNVICISRILGTTSSALSDIFKHT